MPSRPAQATARAVAVLPILFAVAAPAAAEDPALAARVDAYVAPFVDARHLSGSLLIARGQDVLLERSWGWADAEHRIPNGPDTPTGIASVTKPMTIALVCRLAEEGLLAPEDTISRWIPDFPRGNEITVSHLLNHRACIPHRVTTPQEETIPRTAADMVELVKQAGLLPLEPGEKSVYSSAGFSVLARVVELASGRSYDDALQHYLCEPAGMEHTGHHDSRDLVPGRARGYVLDEGGLANGPL
ncbi:MAG: beta-lactamase family protein, partial [Gemmatimonadetes bacterium]|nr:beta-lactamase family protein [Gemmatimonadota bacterium]